MGKYACIITINIEIDIEIDIESLKPTVLPRLEQSPRLVRLPI